ncbi:MAG: protein kinase [Sandaracinaceae bacterium]|nr:protein kinase [Sandaracinaceae bacterium]
MALGNDRFHLIGETPHAHEREAIKFAREQLPDQDPYHLWGLVELYERSTGRTHEIDMLVIGHSAIYLVEAKSHPGQIDGDIVDWRWRPPDSDRVICLTPPFPGANHKAKVIRSRLERLVGRRARVPWVEALVFMSAPDLELKLTGDARTHVVTRGTFRDAIVHHRFPGAPENWRGQRINRPDMLEIVRACEELGFRPRKAKRYVGSYETQELLADGPGYQDRVAVHRTNPHMRAIARTYLVPDQTSVARRQQLLRAAERESHLLWDVRDHPNVLRMNDYVTGEAAPLGPTVLFDPFDRGVPLDEFLKNTPNLELHERYEIIEQVGRALAHCHRRSVVHGAVSPSAILVRRADVSPDGEPRGAIETRLYNFQLGVGGAADPTSHLTAFALDTSAVYQAPEVLENPGDRSPASDTYSLGAVAHLVFTGAPPGTTLVDVRQRLQRAGNLNPADVSGGEISAGICEAIALATELSVASRADSVEDWVELLLEGMTEPTEPFAAAAAASAPADVDPLDAPKGALLGAGDPAHPDEALRVLGFLGQGATSRVLQVRRVRLARDAEPTEIDGKDLALKISLEAVHDERLHAEADAIERFRDSHIVHLEERRVLAGRTCLLLGFAGEHTLQEHVSLNGTLDLTTASRLGEDLLHALEYLEEEARVVHRDIKPANLGVLSLNKQRLRLRLFDFSLASTSPTELNVGTSAYRDPFLPDRAAWDYAADRWSAAVTLHEMLTGARPSFGGSAMAPDAQLRLAAERFDPAARDRLVEFFTCALARQVTDRFQTAADMRHAWVASFEAPAPSLATAPSAAESPAPSGASEPTPAPTSPTAATQATVIDAPSTEPTPATPSDGAAQPSGTGVDAERAYTAADLDPIRPDTPIEALPLSPRARNALDRAGYSRAEELLALPENRLSAIRGVGRLVTREVLAFRNAWNEHAAPSAPSVEAFVPGFVPPSGSRPTLEPVVDGAFAAVLRDAGITILGLLAIAPRAQIEALAEKHGADANALRKALVKASGKTTSKHTAAQTAATSQTDTSGADDTLTNTGEALAPPPGGKTPAEWLDLLLPARPKYAEYVRGLYGLAAPFTGRLNVTMSEAATHFGCSRQNLYLAVGRARDTWAELDALDPLLLLVETIIRDAGGGLSLARAAEAIAALPPSETLVPSREPDPGLARAQAAALFRVAAELEKDETDSIRVLRLTAGAEADASPDAASDAKPGERLFVVATQEHGDAIRRLAKAADRLAARSVLASPDQVQQDLAEAAKGSPFASLDPARLVALAADASGAAACSSRLEIYPRGMSVERALELVHSSGIFRHGLRPEHVLARVRARFPDAAPLPPRPALDALVGAFGLVWDPEQLHYTTRSAHLHTSLSTELHSHTQIGTTSVAPSRPSGVPPSAPRRAPTPAKKVDAHARKSREFDEQLRIAVDRRLFRVVGVNVNHALLAERALAARLGVTPTALDTELLRMLSVKMREFEVDEADVHDIDREGPGGPDWGEFCGLVASAADALADRLFPREGQAAPEEREDAPPLLLTRPGLIARYELGDFLTRLVTASQASDARATFLLVPQFDERGVPHINRTFPIENARGAALHLPFAWVQDHLPTPDRGAA